MANIDNELTIIKEAPRGEDVRAAIVNAIKLISQEKEYPPRTVKFTANATYTADGSPWSKVVVAVPDGGVDINNIDNMNTPITSNGYYTIKDLIEQGYIPNQECIGINGFTVEVPQATEGLCEKMITENGEYDPLLDGFDGYSKVYVNVLGGERKDSYTVKFYNGNQYLGAVTVPHGGNATCPSGNPTSGYFSGWNPNPINVTRDMTCYAVYNEGKSGIGATISTISDSWGTIIANMNAGSRKYAPGDTKTLQINYGGNVHVLTMMLLGYALDKTVNGGYANSTWINVNNSISLGATSPFGVLTKASPYYGAEYDSMHGDEVWWKNSLTRALMNGDPKDIKYDTDPGNDDLSHFNAAVANHLTIPELINIGAEAKLFENIKQVVKYSFYRKQNFPNGGQSGNGANFVYLYDQPTYDKIWIPSTRELTYPKIDTTSGRDAWMCTSGTTYGNPNNYSKWQINTDTETSGTAAHYDSARQWVTRDHDYGTSTGPSQPVLFRRIRNRGDLTTAVGLMDSPGSNNINGINDLSLPVAFCL